MGTSAKSQSVAHNEHSFPTERYRTYRTGITVYHQYTRRAAVKPPSFSFHTLPVYNCRYAASNPAKRFAPPPPHLIPATYWLRGISIVCFLRTVILTPRHLPNLDDDSEDESSSDSSSPAIARRSKFDDEEDDSDVCT